MKINKTFAFVSFIAFLAFYALLIGVSSVYALGVWDEGYRVDSGAVNQEIRYTSSNTCAQVTNTSANDYFAPTITLTEKNAFCGNASGITCAACCVPNCACAANTCTGSTCTNGCSGDCAGTKDCSAPPPPPSTDVCGRPVVTNGYRCYWTEDYDGCGGTKYLGDGDTYSCHNNTDGADYCSGDQADMRYSSGSLLCSFTCGCSIL